MTTLVGAGFIAGRQQALLALVASVTGQSAPAAAQTPEEGEELTPALAHDTGLETADSE